MLSLFRARFPTIAAAGLVDGIDVSGHQSPAMWATLGWRPAFAYIKTSEGSGFVETSAGAHLAAARAAGVETIGPYHFARPDRNNPIVEANLFARQWDAHPWTAPPALDLEQRVTSGSAAPLDVSGWAALWCERVEETTGARPIIYTANWYSPWLRGSEVGAWPLWVAHYPPRGSTGPDLPAQWSDWAVWQWASDTQLGSLDVNVAPLNSPIFAMTTTQEADMTPEEHDTLMRVAQLVSDTHDLAGLVSRRVEPSYVTGVNDQPSMHPATQLIVERAVAAATSYLANKISEVAAQVVAGGGTVDVAAVARAVADELSRRMGA